MVCLCNLFSKKYFFVWVIEEKNLRKEVIRFKHLSIWYQRPEAGEKLRENLLELMLPTPTLDFVAIVQKSESSSNCKCIVILVF